MRDEYGAVVDNGNDHNFQDITMYFIEPNVLLMPLNGIEPLYIVDQSFELCTPPPSPVPPPPPFVPLIKGSQGDALLVGAREHLNLAIQGQTSRKGAPDEVLSLLYADICLEEALGVASQRAAASYRQVNAENMRSPSTAQP